MRINLGYECTTKVVDQVQIHIDHWDGDRTNNDPKNIVYLCACCHAYKTALFRDHLNRYSTDKKVNKKNDWTMLNLLHKERQAKKEKSSSGSNLWSQK